MWFWFAVIALLCWSGSDLFSKIGCQDADDKYSHLKMVMAVGVVMGLHAAYEIFVGGVEISWSVIITYLPVSALYIVSMAVGYLGLRYIELSISSPICNSSGAIVAILIFATKGFGELPPIALVAVALVCIGVVCLGITEANEDESVQGVEVQERADAGDCFDDYGHDGTEHVCDENAYEPACESDDRSFGDQDVANILLSCADCTENTDFTSTLDDGV